jgi:hypothetical protein
MKFYLIWFTKTFNTCVRVQLVCVEYAHMKRGENSPSKGMLCGGNPARAIASLMRPRNHFDFRGVLLVSVLFHKCNTLLKMWPNILSLVI